ncbi:hypothetical protein B0T18DRAFT_413013 [Schizothecium vesticola]|uniref:HD domain-containing protein n=1 Tax=Schizothecium vesticola TaxID=314040 RepID=A0AA40EXC1_9PEZI|nr:hypothetical protein B0T18DRAFT_413013 [Schizothecium vesticola]
MSLLPLQTLTLLTTLYTSPTRHYHSLSHVHALLALLAAHRAAFADPDVVEAAVWFHDAVYNSRDKPPANEAASAELAVEHLRAAGVEEGRVERVRVMILATAAHVVPTAEELGSGGEGAVRDTEMFLDMDLSVLGAEEEEFDEYERGVRKEYEWVDEEGWRKGRGEVLKRFLARERIFYSELFWGLLEERARGNLERAVARLG